jgi:hypothetical protein
MTNGSEPCSAVKSNKPKVLTGLNQNGTCGGMGLLRTHSRTNSHRRLERGLSDPKGICTEHGKPVSLRGIPVGRPQGQPMDMRVWDVGKSKGRPVIGRIRVATSLGRKLR